MLLLALILGLALGGAVAWAVAHARAQTAVVRLEGELEREREAAAEKLAAVDQARTGLEQAFQALSAQALRQNNESFLQLAKGQLEQLHQKAAGELQQRQQAVEHLVKPIKESLERVGAEVKTLEQSRRQDYGSLTAQLRTLGETSEKLRSETGTLVTALRAPAVRGRWGEMQLRRAVEAAGMLSYCDFAEQVTAAGDDGALRPDLVVRLPGGRNVVVDAKAPLTALLDALGCDDATQREAHMAAFGRHVREHVQKLSGKAYWTQFSPAPDFVVMFLPGESFFRAAVEQDPSLLESTVQGRVMLASPTTLITLLQAIAVGWREEKVAESARAVNDLGRELYDRLATLSEHVVTLGRRLNSTVQSYNQAVGSLERRVLVSARRFGEHGIATAKEIPSPAPIDTTAQEPQTIELARPEQASPDAPAPRSVEAA